MAFMNYLLPSLSQSVENIFGSPDDFEESDQLLEELESLEQSDGSDDESSLSDDDLQPINRFVTPKGLEEARLLLIAESVIDDEVHSNTKGCDIFLLNMACAFLTSLFALINGMIFIMKCPEYLVLPSLLMVTGASGITTLPCIIFKVFGINSDCLRRYRFMIKYTTLIILLFQTFIHVAIHVYFEFESFYFLSSLNCKPEFHNVTFISNLFAVSLFFYDFIMFEDFRKGYSQ